MATKNSLDRILFPGNPWPKGHAIKRAAWSGRLDPARGLVFDLHLESADYSAEGPGRTKGDDEDDSWTAPSVWTNYHRCFLSSTKWEHAGLVVGTAKKPFAWGKLSGTTLKADPAKSQLPDDDELAAFGIYLMGHDGVANHAITLTRAGKTWSLDWKAKIALAYVGELDLAHKLHAEVRGLAFTGFALPKGMTPKAARAAFDLLVTDPTAWTITKRHFVRA